jgi:hypothetical protein
MRWIENFGSVAGASAAAVVVSSVMMQTLLINF